MAAAFERRVSLNGKRERQNEAADEQRQHLAAADVVSRDAVVDLQTNVEAAVSASGAAAGAAAAPAAAAVASGAAAVAAADGTAVE